MFAPTLLNPLHPNIDHRPRVLLAICLVLAVLLPASWRAVAPFAAVAPAAHPNLGSLPLSFMPTGDPATPFTAYGMGGSIAFQPSAVTLAQSGARLQIEFIGANPAAAM